MTQPEGVLKRRAILKIYIRENPELVLSQLQIPEWARITGFRSFGDVPAAEGHNSIEIFMETDDPVKFYLTPENCMPPHLYISDEGIVDWSSLDNEGTVRYA